MYGRRGGGVVLSVLLLINILWKLQIDWYISANHLAHFLVSQLTYSYSLYIQYGGFITILVSILVSATIYSLFLSLKALLWPKQWSTTVQAQTFLIFLQEVNTADYLDDPADDLAEEVAEGWAGLECPGLGVRTVEYVPCLIHHHRTRIDLEDKAKVVASVWGQNVLNSLPR